MAEVLCTRCEKFGSCFKKSNLIREFTDISNGTNKTKPIEPPQDNTEEEPRPGLWIEFSTVLESYPKDWNDICETLKGINSNSFNTLVNSTILYLKKELNKPPTIVGRENQYRDNADIVDFL